MAPKPITNAQRRIPRPATPVAKEIVERAKRRELTERLKSLREGSEALSIAVARTAKSVLRNN